MLLAVMICVSACGLSDIVDMVSGLNELSQIMEISSLEDFNDYFNSGDEGDKTLYNEIVGFFPAGAVKDHYSDTVYSFECSESEVKGAIEKMKKAGYEQLTYSEEDGIVFAGQKESVALILNWTEEGKGTVTVGKD